MSDLRAEIYMTVANPKQFLWAPFELAIINIILAVAVMLVCVAALGLNPILAIIPLVAGHGALVVAGTRDQHLFTIVQSIARYPARRRNLARVSQGAKFVP